MRITITNSGSIFFGTTTGNVQGTIQTEPFDATKTVDGKLVGKIFVETLSCDVEFFESSSSEIEVHCYGRCSSNVKFDTRVEERELRIYVIPEGSFYGNLKLDIKIPQKSFEKIRVTTKSANVQAERSVATKEFEVRTISGDVEASISCEEAEISTVSGDVKLIIDAKSNINAGISTVSGDISVKPNNVGHMDFISRSVSGIAINRYGEKGKFSATIRSNTVSGNIEIR